MAKKKKGNGEGSVYKTKNGFRGQIVVGYNDDGKPIRRSVTAKTAKEVNEKLTEIKNSKITGCYIAPDKITICDLARLMIEDDLNLNYIKQATYCRHIDTLKRIQSNPYLKNTPIQELTYLPIKDFLLSETKMSQSLINKSYIMLKKTLNEAVKRKIIKENPVADLRKPKSSQHREKVRALTTDEEMQLYNVLTTEDVNYSHQMLLSMLTGMRMGEINALERRDIDMGFMTISVNKTIAMGLKGEAFVSDSPKTENGNRLIPISETVKPLIDEILFCAGEKYLFENKGKLITTSQVNMQFQRVVASHEILDKTVRGRVSLHSLRHTFATRCIEAGMQPKVLQHLLGHSDIKITLNTYCDAFESFQKENLAKADEYFANMGINLNRPKKARAVC